MQFRERAQTESKKKLSYALIITLFFMGVEIVGGIITKSLALLADAGHMFTDVGALGLSLFAFWLSSKHRTFKKTFGWYRFEIFAAFVNGLTLWIIAGVIVYEAYKRFQSPPEVRSGMMLIVASIGLLANLTSGMILFRSREENLNVKGAFLHVLGDALGSLGVIIASLTIRFTGWMVVDPLVSILICILILWSSWKLIKESFHVLMEGSPTYLDINKVREALTLIHGVQKVHDLHIWSITSGFVSLTAHLVVRENTDTQMVLDKSNNILSSKFGIHHSTIQVESINGNECKIEPCD
ncbi:MAG: cation diffusion facilitator family transporter [Acidobacteriota bacterium]